MINKAAFAVFMAASVLSVGSVQAATMMAVAYGTISGISQQ